MAVLWRTHGKQSQPSWVYFSITLLSIVFVVSVITYTFSFKQVYLQAGGEKRLIATRARTVADFLSERKIPYTIYDQVTPSLDDPITNGMKISLRWHTPLTLVIDGKKRKVVTMSSLVSQVLNQSGINLKSDIRIWPPLTSRVFPGELIYVDHLSRRLETIDNEIPFEVKRQDDPSLLRGISKVAVKGEKGLRRQVIEHVIANGQEISTNLKSDVIVKQPIAKVIKIGTKVPQLAALPRQPQPVVAQQSQVVARGGRVMRMVATGYASGDGGGAGARTATGTGVHRGIVAVDPRVIPLGTKLYIEGYGSAVAADTGGAIKGNRIDLAFNSVAEARQWGRRTVIVHITN